MKTLQRNIIIAIAAIALCCTIACGRTNSADEISKEAIEQIKTEIVNELGKVSTDSLSEKVIYVQPTVVSSGGGSPFKAKLLIPLFGIVIPFAAFVGVVWVVMHFRRERQRDKYKIIELSIQKGQQLPDSFYLGERLRKSRLQSGIIWLGCGLALFIWGLGDSDELTAALGIIPFFVGVARIVTYFVEDRKTLRKIEAADEDVKQD